MIPPPTAPPFDSYAQGYEAALMDGLRYSGEDAAYFARGRIEWLADRLRGHGASSSRVLDFGCGTGSAASLLLEVLGAEQVIGADVSARLLERARSEHASAAVQFRDLAEPLNGWADVAYCNGVFHHIDPAKRQAAARWVWRALQPSGMFALWENNPLNPGTRFIMSRIAFDRDAKTMRPGQTRALLRAAGFEVLSTDSLFYFPRALRALRRLEPSLAKIPLGGQYLVLARRPGPGRASEPSTP